jgi:hypothetical protein
MKRQQPSKRRSRAPKNRRGSQPTIIAGETAPDEHNANVQQSESEEGEGDPWGDAALTRRKRPEGEFLPGEIGDEDESAPHPDNPQAAQGGRGPLTQEGEGNRQNDEFAELEEPAEKFPPETRS